MGKLIFYAIIMLGIVHIIDAYGEFKISVAEAEVDLINAQTDAYTTQLQAEEEAMRACGKNFICGFTKVINSIFG